MYLTMETHFGFKLMGPVPTYSFLQSVGLINDHLEACDFKY
ncbi:DNA-3-methyladenine glycosylase I [Limosilactobacillus frumenti]|nr:DNA-3-methyladenine glycosylase I [Limosilactobacillus frumenti]QFG71975.1 DNA-3-methyladenine glycosylase I [Limosilactobacillus frumenti]